ncbi:MAG: putative rane protein [Devosia sp.]|uniref:HdeD family acid-resistance protein n=1 Tax=Devosia sp. TaxID=1871048 RepID=UPI00262E3A64|nr:DUF308 domain-containing protein [Devosia sp.]MDB5542645.1 putative rane protein [Devosia sp.]
MATEARFNWPGIFAAIRGVLMLAGGLFALFAPQLALATLVWVGGIIVIIDGALGLWGLLFGGRTSPRLGVSVTRHILAILAGVLIVAFPTLASSIGISALVITVGVIMVLAGAFALYVTVSGRSVMREGTFWPEMLSAGAYLLFGLLLIFMPLSSAMVLVSIVGVLMILYGLFQLYIAWQLRGLGASV